MVEGVARRFHGSSELVEDLAQEGFIGLLTAIDLYDPAKKVKFSTYATHFVIGQIKHCLRDRGKIIKEPAWLQELNQKVSKVIEALSQQLGHVPSNAEVGEAMGMEEEQVAELMMTRETFKVSSIDGGSDNDDDQATVNIERRKTNDQSVSFQLPLEERIVLDAAMDKLKELEQKVLAEFYFKDLNQTEIAKNLDISCNYVSHILRTSTKKLKKILATNELAEAQRRDSLLAQSSAKDYTAERDNLVDGLTRLYNRRYYEARLEEEISRTSREGKPASVLMIRVRNFSPFRQSFGTMPADEAIRETAAVIRNAIRKVDIVTRYDAETFALILPYTGDNAFMVQERIEESLGELYATRGWNIGAVGLVARCGYATAPEEARFAMALTLKAMQRLEQSEDGRQALPKAA